MTSLRPRARPRLAALVVALALAPAGFVPVVVRREPLPALPPLPQTRHVFAFPAAPAPPPRPTVGQATDAFVAGLLRDPRVVTRADVRQALALTAPTATLPLSPVPLGGARERALGGDARAMIALTNAYAVVPMTCVCACRHEQRMWSLFSDRERLAWLRRAAGDAGTMVALGRSLRGQGGRARGDREHVAWFARAALAGSQEGLSDLAAWTARSEAPWRQAIAAELYRRADERHHAYALVEEHPALATVFR